MTVEAPECVLRMGVRMTFGVVFSEDGRSGPFVFEALVCGAMNAQAGRGCATRECGDNAIAMWKAVQGMGGKGEV